jgi:Putative MetA-pathway of phenol degradation
VVRSLKKTMIKQALAFCAGLAIAAVTEPCWAIDYQPFDFVPAAPGTMMMMGYYEFETRNQVNNTIAGTFNHDTSLDSQIGLARYLYYNQFHGTPFLLEWLQPFGVEYNGKINGTRLNDAWGASDLILSGTLWPISKPQQKTWVSVSDWITVPSGSYTHTRAVNLGANRWQNDIQIDYTQGFLGKWTWDAAGDWIAYGPNRNVGAANLTLSQTSTYNAYTWVSYDITDVMRRAMPSLGAASVSMGYAGTFGGVQKLAGYRNGNETHEQQLRWTYEQFVAPKWQVLLSLNHDVSVSGQFKDTFGLIFRLTRVF